MNTLANIQELARALRNMIRTGLVVETDLNAGRCRADRRHVHRLASVADPSRRTFAHMVGTFRGGEQVLILSVGGELDTAFVLPGIYSGDNPAPSASADAPHIRFPDGAVIEYEPETSALTVSGIKTASVTASDSVTATVPVVMVKSVNSHHPGHTGGGLHQQADYRHAGSAEGREDARQHRAYRRKFTSNGVQVDDHGHGGVKSGDNWTQGTK